MTTGITFITISFFIILIAIKLISDIRKISDQGVEVKGIVYDVEQIVGTDNNMSYPVIRFLTKENNWITKLSKVGTIPGIYKKGKEVTVVYQKDNPENFFIKNKFSYLIPTCMIIIAILFTSFGILFF